jgi:hypothetical protein
VSTPTPLLRATFELDAEDDRHASLVSVERVDGLLGLHRYQSYRGKGSWQPEMCLPCDPDVEWFERDWESVGSDLLGDDLDGVRKLVVEGRMFCDYYDNPIQGAGYDSGFDVENVVERIAR